MKEREGQQLEYKASISHLGRRYEQEHRKIFTYDRIDIEDRWLLFNISGASSKTFSLVGCSRAHGPA